MLETIGYDAAVAASYAPWDVADASVGRVLRVDRGVATVLTEQGPDRVTIGGGLLARMAADPDASPCLGDWVVVRSWPDHRLTLEQVLPRRTALRAPAAVASDPALVVVGANVDVVALVAVRRRAVTPDVPPDVPLVDAAVGPHALRERLEGHLTLALLGDDRRAGAALVDGLVGADSLAAASHGPELVLLPTGGAVLDLTDSTRSPTR